VTPTPKTAAEAHPEQPSEQEETKSSGTIILVTTEEAKGMMETTNAVNNGEECKLPIVDLPERGDNEATPVQPIDRGAHR